MENKFQTIIDFIKSLYPAMNPVLLHCPQFAGKEKEYLAECIDTTFVSYIGRFVTDFENSIKNITGSKYAIAIVNGTEALHMALLAVGVKPKDEVITQSLTFAATCVAIVHSGGSPIFVDVEKETLGMSPESLLSFLEENAIQKDGLCINKITGNVIRAVVPMHTFGHPCKIQDMQEICQKYNIILVEDSAESLGSFYKGKHTGTFGKVGILSFNGNKLITCGGGGMVITDDEHIANRIKYLSTTAKEPHPYEFVHNEVGFNLRMPSVNAAIGFAQMEYIETSLKNKRETAKLYSDFFKTIGIDTVNEPKDSISNFWLNAILLNDRTERDAFLKYTNENGVQTRPIWVPMHKLKPYKDFQKTDLSNTEFLESKIVNIPSSVRI